MATKKAASSTTSKRTTAAATKAASTPAARRTEATTAFTAEERAAMKAAAAEQRARSKKGRTAADDLADVLDRIAAMPDADRALAERVHAIVTTTAPHLTARLWYGMPAYAKDGKVLIHFQDAAKFKSRYATLGFSDVADLDDGSMWPTSFALTRLSAADEKRIAALVRKAAG